MDDNGKTEYLSSSEMAFYQAGIVRGQHQGLSDSASQLSAAVKHYADEVASDEKISDDQNRIMTMWIGVISSVANQLSAGAEKILPNVKTTLNAAMDSRSPKPPRLIDRVESAILGAIDGFQRE